MQKKFTPGPWVVNHSCEDVMNGKISVETQGGYYIAQVDESDKQEANARLIASAPDLLDALETMQRDGNYFAEWHPKFHKAIAKARAAIAKATGQEV